MTVASNPKRFFHAVREIERDVLHTDRVYAHQQEQRVGYDGNPAHELIRFQGDKTLDFCPVESTEKQLSVNNKQALEVSFFGLFGSQGILPQHYTELMLSRLKQKDTSLVDFLDLFNHRLSSLFYRAWEKHQFPVQLRR